MDLYAMRHHNCSTIDLTFYFYFGTWVSVTRITQRPFSIYLVFNDSLFLLSLKTSQGSSPGRSQVRSQVSGTPWPETWTWPAFFGTPDLRPDLTCVFLRPPDLLTLTWDLQVWVTVCFFFSHPFCWGGCYFVTLLLFSKLPHPIVS